MNKPHMFSNPSEQSWVDTLGSRASSDFQGSLVFTGGSMPEEGKSPFDDFKGPSMSGGLLSPNDFWGNGPMQSEAFGANPMS